MIPSGFRRRFPAAARGRRVWGGRNPLRGNPPPPTRREPRTGGEPPARRDPAHPSWPDRAATVVDRTVAGTSRVEATLPLHERSPGSVGRPAADRLPGEPPRLPSKLTVTRLALWRGRLLAGRAMRAYHRALAADGADRSGLAALTTAVMAQRAGSTALAVGLVATLFLPTTTAPSPARTALFLLVTAGTFALVAPVIGPVLDRLGHGRRAALAACCLGEAFAAVVMALHVGDPLLYPATLAATALAMLFTVLRAGVTPRLSPQALTLPMAGARLSIFASAAGTVAGVLAAGLAGLFHAGGALGPAAALFLLGAVLCRRIPPGAERTAGEVPVAPLLRRRGALPMGTPSATSLGRRVVVALWACGTTRVLTGFVTVFAAFTVQAVPGLSPGAQWTALGVVAAAAGTGHLLGTGMGTRRRIDPSGGVVPACVGVALGVTVLAAAVPGVVTAALLALVAAGAGALARVAMDEAVQQDVPAPSRASAGGRSEPVLQVAWVFGTALGVTLPARGGAALLAVLLALGLAQTLRVRRTAPRASRPAGTTWPERPGAAATKPLPATSWAARLRPAPRAGRQEDTP